MTKLCLLNLTDLADGRWRELLAVLPAQRRKLAESCRFEADQVRAAGAGWLLQYALQQAGVPISQQQFSENPWGKPELTQGGIHFNLSHSGSWAVCAVSDRPVGVDVELPRCSMDLAKRHFRPDELEGLEALPWQARKDALNRLWTAKEAFVKALGCGLTVKLDSFAVRLLPEGAVLEQTQSPLPYVLHEYVLHPCRLCLCCTDVRPEPEIVTP